MPKLEEEDWDDEAAGVGVNEKLDVVAVVAAVEVVVAAAAEAGFAEANPVEALKGDDVAAEFEPENKFGNEGAVVVLIILVVVPAIEEEPNNVVVVTLELLLGVPKTFVLALELETELPRVRVVPNKGEDVDKPVPNKVGPTDGAEAAELAATDAAGVPNEGLEAAADLAEPRKGDAETAAEEAGAADVVPKRGVAEAVAVEVEEEEEEEALMAAPKKDGLEEAEVPNKEEVGIGDEEEPPNKEGDVGTEEVVMVVAAEEEVEEKEKEKGVDEEEKEVEVGFVVEEGKESPIDGGVKDPNGGEGEDPNRGEGEDPPKENEVVVVVEAEEEEEDPNEKPDIFGRSVLCCGGRVCGFMAVLGGKYLLKCPGKGIKDLASKS